MTNAQILVVEDEAIVAREIQNTLKRFGYAVPVVASSADEAVEKASETHPDLVLMDIRLKGGTDGVKAAEQIRARFDIPVVYVTAYADEEILRRAKITEPYGYILKPFEDREIHTNIEIALHKHNIEKKLKQSKQWLATTLESMGDAVIACDPKGRIVFMNPVAEAVTHCKHKDVLGALLSKVFNIISEETNEMIEDVLARPIKEGVGVSLTNYTFIAKDGAKTPLDDSIAPIRDDKGNITGVVLVFRDATERKKAEKKLLEYQAKLKSLASELTLVEERERLRIATELNDQIAQSLVVSKMELEMLRESVYPTEVHSTLGKICDALGQAIQDTRSLTLDLSSPVLRVLGFEAAVAEWLVWQIQEKHGIISEFENDGQPKPLDDDLRAVLFRNMRELLHNVVKHAHAHKVKVSARKVGNQIYVSVEDDGIGFDPGKVVAMAGKTGGFGLFSIRERLEELGGHIEIDSEPGHGAKIILVAPLKQEKTKGADEV
jgi:PAS domain S-box-containing protein